MTQTLSWGSPSQGHIWTSEDTQHLFTCLLVISMSLFPIQIMRSFLVELLVFLLLSCRSSLSILDTPSLPGIWLYHSKSFLLLSFQRAHFLFYFLA